VLVLVSKHVSKDFSNDSLTLDDSTNRYAHVDAT